MVRGIVAPRRAVTSDWECSAPIELLAIPDLPDVVLSGVVSRLPTAGVEHVVALSQFCLECDVVLDLRAKINPLCAAVAVENIDPLLVALGEALRRCGDVREDGQVLQLGQPREWLLGPILRPRVGSVTPIRRG